MKKKNSPPSEKSHENWTLGGLAHILSGPSAFAIFGLLIAWSILQPLDSTAVFHGDALGQNFGWILLALLVALLGCTQPLYQRVGNRELAIICALAGWMLMVTIRASWFCNPRTGWNGFWHVIGLLCFYYSSRCLLVSARNRSMTILVLLAAGVVLAVVSIHQILIDFPAQRAHYELNPDLVLRQLGLDAPAGSPQRLRYEARLYSPEPLATFALTNSLAVLLSGLLVLTLGTLGRFLRRFGIQNDDEGTNDGLDKSQKTKFPKRGRQTSARGEPKPSLLWRLISLLVLVGLMSFVWILTRSRVAYVAVLISAGALLVKLMLASGKSSARARTQSLPDHRIRRLIVGLVAVSFVSLGLLWWFDESLFTGAINSISFRRDYWTATVRMIQDHWLWGIGLGNFQGYYPRYMLPTASETIADPHNWLLDLSVNCSLPFSAILVIGFLCLFFLKSARQTTTEDDSSHDSASPGANSQQNSSKILTYRGRFLDLQANHHWWIALGAGLGGLLVGSALWLFGLNLPLVFIALCFAIALVTPIWPLVQSANSHDTSGARLAAMTMALCLLVSGCWQAPGLIIPLICLVACSTGDIRTLRSDVPRVGRPSTSEALRFASGNWRGYLILGAVSIGLILFVYLGWNPVLRSDLVGMSQQASLSLQIEATKQAKTLDPLDCKWNRFLAAQITQAAVQSTDKETFALLAEKAVSEITIWTEREPVNFLTWQAAGNRALDLAAASEGFELANHEFLLLAANCAEEAVRAFPTSVQLRVQSAYCRFLIGEESEALIELDKALELDASTPHSDRKLPSQVVWTPDFEGQPEFSTGSADQWSPAEPLLNWLRMQL